MRLLNVSSLSLEDFPPNGIPSYAILSHTWGTDEVTAADIHHPIGKSKPSWGKILSTCEQAKADHLQYVWIDTCCIDKFSSAELSETLNSIYLWYEKAAICYAYLVDVPKADNPRIRGSAFERSRWFSRGWTLQELIAPREVIFFSNDWTEIGRKTALCDILERITRIQEDILIHRRPLSSMSLARRMAWAAYRETTRPEDIAYCLMGIFSVNMPMLYGEGKRAFLRLQEEIIKSSDDQSLFAWIDTDASPTSLHGLLATSPSQFAFCHDILPYQDWQPRTPYLMTNRGLQIELPILWREEDTYVAALDCPCPPDYSDTTFLAIYLKKMSKVSDQYARVKVGTLAEVSERGKPKTIYIHPSGIVPHNAVEGLFPKHYVQLRGFRAPSNHAFVKTISANHRGEKPPAHILSSRNDIPAGIQKVFKLEKQALSLSCFVVMEGPRGKGLLILLGSNGVFDIGFDAIEADCPREFAHHDLDTVRKHYKPKTPGTWVTLQNHRAMVNVQPQVHNGAKYYMVELEIKPIRESNGFQGIVEEMETKLQADSTVIRPRAVIKVGEIDGEKIIPQVQLERSKERTTVSQSQKPLPNPGKKASKTWSWFNR